MASAFKIFRTLRPTLISAGNSIVAWWLQAWIGTGGMRLLRPVSAVPAEGEDEEAAAAAAAAAAASLAPTLKMLDDNRSSLHIPNVLYEPSTVFLKRCVLLSRPGHGIASPSSSFMKQVKD